MTKFLQNTDKEEKIRTVKQNKSLHKFCELLAETCNEAGISQRLLLEGLEVDNSPESVKAVFRAMGKAKYGKDSTTKLTTKEMMDIFDEFTRHIAKLGIYIPWPTEEELYYQKQNDISNRK